MKSRTARITSRDNPSRLWRRTLAPRFSRECDPRVRVALISFPGAALLAADSIAGHMDVAQPKRALLAAAGAVALRTRDQETTRG